jgi:hypothetical protein
MNNLNIIKFNEIDNTTDMLIFQVLNCYSEQTLKLMRETLREIVPERLKGHCLLITEDVKVLQVKNGNMYKLDESI